eukprot:gene30040-48032_t
MGTPPRSTSVDAGRAGDTARAARPGPSTMEEAPPRACAAQETARREGSRRTIPPEHN